MTKCNDSSQHIAEDDCLKSDGDGIPAAAEVLAPSTHAQGTRGTHPLDPASTFHIHSLQPAADGMRLQLSPLRHRRLAKPRLPAVPGNPSAALRAPEPTGWNTAKTSPKTSGPSYSITSQEPAPSAPSSTLRPVRRRSGHPHHAPQMLLPSDSGSAMSALIYVEISIMPSFPSCAWERTFPRSCASPPHSTPTK